MTLLSGGRIRYLRLLCIPMIEFSVCMGMDHVYLHEVVTHSLQMSQSHGQDSKAIYAFKQHKIDTVSVPHRFRSPASVTSQSPDIRKITD